MFLKSIVARRNMKAVDVTTGKLTRWQTDAHAAPINALLPLAGGLVASGDDDGCVKLWDGRQSPAVAEYSAHTDYVSDFAHQVWPSGSQAPAKHRQFVGVLHLHQH